MSATTVERSLTKKQLGEPLPPTLAFPMKASSKVLKGTLVCLDAGYAKAAVLATDLLCCGRAKKTVDNTSGDDGDLMIEVEQGSFKWENNGDITQADVGTAAYMADNQTVQADATGASSAGTIFKVEDDGVWVYTSLAVPVAGSVMTVGTRTTTLTHGAVTAAPDTDGTLYVQNLGAILPTGAIIIGHDVLVTTLFSGGGSTSATVDVGGTDDDAIVTNLDVFTGAATGHLPGAAGVQPTGYYSGQQLVVTLDADNATKTSEFTAGVVTITVYYIVVV